MSSETGLEDMSLIDLFRSEVETHSELLSAALLALERSPSDTSRIDEMMRAAHSIKGAARVVGVDAGRPCRSRHGGLLRRGAKGSHRIFASETLMSCCGGWTCWARSRRRRGIPTRISLESSAVSSKSLLPSCEAVLSGKGKSGGVSTASAGTDVVASPARTAQKSEARRSRCTVAHVADGE